MTPKAQVKREKNKLDKVLNFVLQRTPIKKVKIIHRMRDTYIFKSYIENI